MGMMMGNSLVQLVPVQLPNGQVRSGGRSPRAKGSQRGWCAPRLRPPVAQAPKPYSCLKRQDQGCLHRDISTAAELQHPRHMHIGARHSVCPSHLILLPSVPLRNVQIGYMMGGMAPGAVAGGDMGGAGGPVRGSGSGYGGGGRGSGSSYGGGRGRGRGGSGGGGQRYTPY